MDFQKEVIEESFQVPVVVDFWAPWCGPCQYLGPVIEKLAEEASGKWKLVKVNTDENPDLSMRYGIQGIPAVKMFYRGEVVAEFTGALPEPQLRQWLQKHLPDKRKAELQNILENLRKEPGQPWLEKLKAFVQANPDYEEAKAELARYIVFDDITYAKRLVGDIRLGSDYYELAEDIRNLAAIYECDKDVDSPVTQKIEEAKKELDEKNYEGAIEKLIEAVMLDKGYCDELPRKAAIALFHLLGNQHPVTRKYRRRFDMALY